MVASWDKKKRCRYCHSMTNAEAPCCEACGFEFASTPLALRFPAPWKGRVIAAGLCQSRLQFQNTNNGVTVWVRENSQRSTPWIPSIVRRLNLKPSIRVEGGWFVAYHNRRYVIGKVGQNKDEASKLIVSARAAVLAVARRPRSSCAPVPGRPALPSPHST